MRALVGGFPDDAQIFNLGAHGKLWYQGHDIFVSMALRHMQVGLQTMVDGTLLVWFHRVPIGWVRLDPGMPRQITVLPLPLPEVPPVSRDGQGDRSGDAKVVTALSPSAPRVGQVVATGDTEGDTPSAAAVAVYPLDTVIEPAPGAPS
jgi:hypothetical protein